jgi:hypothetical protein
MLNSCFNGSMRSLLLDPRIFSIPPLPINELLIIILWKIFEIFASSYATVGKLRTIHVKNWESPVRFRRCAAAVMGIHLRTWQQPKPECQFFIVHRW